MPSTQTLPQTQPATSPPSPQPQAPTQTYTTEEIGRRIRERNPEAFKGLNYTDAAIGARAVQRKPELQKLVRQGVQESQPSQQAQTPQPGVLESAANTVNNAYEGYKNLPGVKQVTDIAGMVVGAPSALIGGAVGAIGTPIANAIKGRPLLENLKENTLGNAKDTYDFGYNIGKEGTAGAPLGAAGKAVTIPMAFAQGYQGYTDVKQGLKEGNTEQALSGALALGTAALSARSAAGEKGILINQGPKQAVINRFPATKPVSAPVKTATEAVTSAAKPIINKAAELPLVQNVKNATKEIMSGRSFEREAIQNGIDDHLLNAFEPGRLVPGTNKKTGNVIPESVAQQQNQKASGLYQRFQDYRRIAERAVRDDAAPPPLEVAGRKAGDALGQYQQKLNKWGEIKKQELAQIGNKTMEITPTRVRFLNDLKGSLGTVVNKGMELLGDKFMISDAPGRRSKIALDPADRSLLASVAKEFDNLGDINTVTMIDDTIDALQDLLYKRKQNVAIPVNSQVERIIKKAVGELNSKLKSVAGERYRKANDKYAYFIDTYQKLNKALGPDESKAASLAKRVFSPTDGGTRELFNQVKRDTGIDLVLEARMAKQAGELAGDTRQRGLLESIDMLPKAQSRGGMLGFFQEGVGFVKRQMSDPEQILKKAGQQKTGLRREDL